jgi:hypothetical protein
MSGKKQAPGLKAALLYWGVLPILVGGNLGLGLLALSELRPNGGLPSLILLGTGAFCCVLAGAIGALGWSKSYWGAAMRRQLTVWRIVVDTVFAWMETLPLSVESMNQLKRSLDERVFVQESPPGR